MRPARTITIAFALLLIPAAAFADPPARETNSFRETVKQVLPAVVSLEPQTRAARRMPLENWPKEFEPWLPFIGTAVPDVDGKPVRLGSGSGFIIDPKGVVVTNYHVVKGASQVEVRLKDGRTFIATDIKSDPKTDIAIVRLPAKETLPALKWGDSQSVEIGDHVLAVGAPFGLTGTVTHGIISGKGRSLNLHPYEDYVQTDAAINPGNSGGPLVTLDGKVVGVNSVIKSRSGGFQGVGLAVSSHLAKQVVDELMKNGAVARAYLGVKVGDLDKAVAERMGLGGKGGAVVADVLPDTPAAKAGLKDGDIITSLAGKPVPSAMDLTWSVWRLAAGKPVEVAILRDGKPITVTVTPEKQPDDFGLASESRKSKSTGPGAVHLEKIGAWAADFTAEMADRYGFKDRFDGAVIVRVDPSGWAAATGLRPGAVIVKVDDRPVATAREAAKAVADGSLTEGIQFQYRTALSGTGYLMIRSSRER